jgi:predicted acetyltransferase
LEGFAELTYIRRLVLIVKENVALRGVKMELCQACGHENKKSKVTCEKCGSVLENSGKEEHAEKQRLNELLRFSETTY